MKSLQKITVASTILALGVIVLMSPTISIAQQETATDSASTTSECFATDVKGHFEYTGNHVSSNPIKGFFENIATNGDCSDEVYVHIFGSNIAPESDGWFDSQVHVATQTLTIPQGSNQNVEVTVPSTDYCWYQVDATRTSEVRTPPLYNGVDMIDYVFVENPACVVTPTPTATPSATPTEGPTATPTPGSSTNSNNNSTGEVAGATATKTVDSIQATLGTSTMANTGGFTDMLANSGLVTGMIVSALGALSYAKDKKAARSL